MFSLRLRKWLSPVVVGLFLAGCEHADPLGEDGAEATLSSIQTNIFNANCALSGCHVGGAVLPGSMDLRAGESFSSIVGVPSEQRPGLDRVEPGDPDASYLVRKIEGGPDIMGMRMPAGRAALSQDEIDLVREWIADGAVNN